MTWMPIDSAPISDDEGPFVLVYGPDGVDKARYIGWPSEPYWQRVSTADYDNDYLEVTRPTHWMPLPPPPEQP